MKYKKIVFVCTGNTCRSPMAEAALRAELKKRKIRWYKVESAGVKAEVGAPMTQYSAEALREAGIPFSKEFKARQLTRKMVDEAHVVLCMTERICRYVNIGNTTSMYDVAGREIPDPYGQGLEVYRETLHAIQACLPDIIEAFCPPIDTKPDPKSIK